MKKKLSIASAVTCLILGIFTLSFVKKADNYSVDLSKASVTWFGKKLTGSHNGTLALKNGNLLFDGKKLVGGEFVADMTSLKEAEGNERLEKHLKSDDFFAVDKFAEAKFTIKNVSGSGADVQVTGDFNIKGKVNSVSFPVKLVWNKDKTVTATAEKITIDRTKYGIEYKSKSVFSTLGNNFIDDEFTISVKLVAKK